MIDVSNDTDISNIFFIHVLWGSSFYKINFFKTTLTSLDIKLSTVFVFYLNIKNKKITTKAIFLFKFITIRISYVGL